MASPNTPKDHAKLIHDPIHGLIRLEDYIVATIDTEEFQRLRYLMQLGSAYYVFPGASHNRFEHSIGVSHLAGQLIDRFKREQPALEITDSEVKCVKLAGLCHDLGHGPFSHVFDREFMPRVRGLDNPWSHEKASEMMLDSIIDNPENIVDVTTEEVRLIKDLITGEKPESLDKNRHFLFDIVANKRNSVDVDKFDYLQRDCHNLSIKTSYDVDRLMNYCRVINGEICYYQKEVYNLYDMFHTRYSMFKRIYTHRVGKAVEYMIIDALVEADPVLKISSQVDDPKEYLHLTDDILHIIERSTSDELSKSRGILKRLRTRKLYRFVDERLIPIEMSNLKDKITSQRIVEYQSDNDHLSEDDVIVEWLKINYAMKDQNPVDKIRFYDKYNEKEPFTIPKSEVSGLIPENFEEIVVRVFTRDQKKLEPIKKAFKRLMANYF